MAFNGTGYADMNSPEDFLDSYITYKTMRKHAQATRLAQVYRPEALLILEVLLEKTYGAGRKPVGKKLKKFEQFKNQQNLL